MSGRPPFHETLEEDDLVAAAPDIPIPGLVLVFSVTRPMLHPIPLASGALELGRGVIAGAPIDDERCSRQHARVELDGGTWRVHDYDSRNGTFVDGARVQGDATAAAPHVLRIGRTVLLFQRDVRAFTRGSIEVGEIGVIGPSLRTAWDAIAQASRAGDTLLITGESGTGKELAARAFHNRGRSSVGPFVGVNCAAIPEGVAERLLFGARRGAFSGAMVDADGYLQTADGGTLFLDEVAELDPAVQAKLLRVLETKEVMALGAAKPRVVDVRVCAATCKDVHRQVASGQFRDDLYFRIGRPEVRLPPLRHRLEEIPFLAVRELNRVDSSLTAHHAFIEACMLRPWPGNVRELIGETRRAAHAAMTDGRAIVEARDLAQRAGLDIGTSLPPEPTPAAAAAGSAVNAGGAPERPEIEAALRRENGNVTRAAKVLGMHRNQLRRWLARNNVDPAAFGGAAESDPDETVS